MISGKILHILFLNRSYSILHLLSKYQARGGAEFICTLLDILRNILTLCRVLFAHVGRIV
ncbi:MAG TPA: hypothetical protein DDY68_01600 [Porphyromonadaceae bacterium]|nr:hypothetical protein [Porphyromonadaceae bacterium]